jgi:hypothetical protein
MTSRKIGQCKICRCTGLLAPEHVIPSWLFKCYETPGAGPFTMVRRPTPLTRRDGRPVASPSLERVLLDVCPDCNAWLNDTFEVPAKIPIRRLGGGQTIADADAFAVARWAAKTLILYGHPAARRSNQLHMSIQRPMLQDGAELARALRRTGEIPADVSLWAASIDKKHDPQTHVVPERIWPSRTSRTDGAGGPVDAINLGLGVHSMALTVTMTLVSHPLVDIENHWEEAGLAMRIWPNPPARLTLTDLPALDVESGRRSVDWLGDSGMSVALGPGERWGASHPLARMIEGAEWRRIGCSLCTRRR